MSPTCGTGFPSRPRVPKFSYNFDAVELPVRYGPHVPEVNRWTLTLITDPETGFLMGASLYNGNYNRGAYFTTGHRHWNLSLYDYPRGSGAVPKDIMDASTDTLFRALGPSFKVTHDTLAAQEINE